MRALIIIAHGSRHEAANAEFRDYVSNVRVALGDIYEHVSHAFLAAVPPRLKDAALAAMAAGATRIDVYPFFLNRGRHVDSDIPALMHALQAAYPACRIALLDYLGKADGLVALSNRHIRAHF